MDASDGPFGIINYQEVGYLLQLVKVTMKVNLPQLNVGSVSFPEFKQGENQEVPRWVAEIFSDMGFADVEEESFEIELFKALSKERIQAPTQLSTLGPDFYAKMRLHLAFLRAKSQGQSSLNKELERLQVSGYDLITLRSSKLLHLASSSSPPSDVLLKLPAEERALFEDIHRRVTSWRKALLEGTSR